MDGKIQSVGGFVERTFVMLKPDAVRKRVLGEVIGRIEGSGLNIIGMKMVQLNESICREHYAHHADKPFFKSLVKFMCSAPVVCMVVEGEEAVQRVRELAGPTDSRKAPKGTIRGDLGANVQENIIHASDSKETAEKEIMRFFKEDEIFSIPPAK